MCGDRADGAKNEYVSYGDEMVLFFQLDSRLIVLVFHQVDELFDVDDLFNRIE